MKDNGFENSNSKPVSKQNIIKKIESDRKIKSS